MKEKLHTRRVLVVEGKYDAARLAGITDAVILQTDGFSIYTDRERQQLFKRLARQQGLLILTDSDAAGFRIRTFLTNLAGQEHVLQAYIPMQKGKEKRKAEPGKEGLLGVEGIADNLLYDILAQALKSDAAEIPAKETQAAPVTYTDLYDWGFSGTAGAAERKAQFLRALGLPPRLSKKELIEVLNRLYTREELEEKRKAASQG